MTAQSTAMIEREVRISARPEIVFGLLTDPSQLLRWQGLEAELEPRPGGVYRVKLNSLGQWVAGQFVEVVPHSRIVFTWGWDPPAFPVPAGSTTVEINLRAEGGQTVLHFRHSGLPNVPEVTASHGAGWDHYFQRLAILAAGGELPYDPWLEGKMDDSTDGESR